MKKKITHKAPQGGAKSSRTAPKKHIFAWESPEHQTHKKGAAWYVVMAVCLAGVIAYGIYDHAWTFILALVVGIIAYYYFILREKPRMLDISLTNHEIKIDRFEYPYAQIKYFWIVNKPETKMLNIRLKKHFMPDIAIFLNKQNPEEIRNFLKGKIMEIEKNEGVTNTLVRILKI